MIIDDYLNLITSAWRNKAKYTSMISSDVSTQVQVQDLMIQMMMTLFDLDLAIGGQLDIIGQWVGISRNINIPITGIYFSWDDTEFTGWDFGIWQASSAPANITILPDDVYRTLIKSKIAANQWDGTTTGMYDIWSILFPTLDILIKDNQDMSYDLIFVGTTIDSLTLALITGGYLPLKPEGVRVSAYYIPVDDNPIFGWDQDTTYIQGWDEGAWARQLTST